MPKAAPVSILSLMLFTALSICGSQASAHQITRIPIKECEPRLMFVEALKEFNTPVSGRVVEIIGERKGDNGGMYFVLAIDPNFNMTWLALDREIPSAPSGDPRQFVSIAGSEIAYFFGIRELDKFQMTAPNIEEINGSIKKMNTALIALGFQPIPISYNRQVGINPNAMMFLKNFAEKLQLPFAPEGHIYVHDISFHLASIMLPVEILQPVVEQYQQAIAFYNFAITKTSDLTVVKQLEDYLEVLQERIDFGLGDIQTAYAGYAHDQVPAEVKKSGREQFKITLRLSRLTHCWQNLATTEFSMRELVMSSIDKAAHKSANFEAKSKTLDLAEKFFAQSKFKSIDIAKSYPLSGQQIFDKILQRQNEMKQAIEFLKKGKKK